MLIDDDHRCLVADFGQSKYMAEETYNNLTPNR